MRNIPKTLKVIALASVLSIGISYVSAWTAPTVTPPGGNVAAPINVGATTQYKDGALGVGGVFHGYSSATFDGQVKIGNSVALCASSNAGAMRFNAGAFEGCNGTSWEVLSSVGGGSCPKVGGSYQLSITANTTSYNVYSQAQLCGGINLLASQNFTVTVASGVDVGNFTTGSLVSGSTVNIVNNGTIFGVLEPLGAPRGIGGTGGAAIGQSGSAGYPGNHAVTLTPGVLAQIDNTNGYILGGGGGGGGGAGAGGGTFEAPTYPGGAGGNGADAHTTATAGIAGSVFGSGSGGAGGGIATAGAGGGGTFGTPGGAGGAAGKAVSLNGGTVTWVGGNNATRVKGLVN